MRRFFLRLFSFLRPGRAEEELSREIESHMQLLEDDFVARGMPPAEARIAARRAFGRPDDAKELHRESRSFALLDRWRLDMRLGLRLLVKHRGLSLVGGIGIAVGVAISVAMFSVIGVMIYPELPLEEGHRIVALENRDQERNNEERRSVHDFITWREELRSVEHLAAFRNVTRNLIVSGATPERIVVAEMTAAGFRVPRVAPRLGRYFVEADEAPDAAPVIVIGHDVWQSRFQGDPAVIGRDLRLGSKLHTIVGVMPGGFRFPESHHDEG